MKLVAFLLLLAAQPLIAKDRSVSVTGDCLRNLTPDRGAVILVAQTIDSNAGTATQKAMEQYGRLRDRVKKLNLKNLELETSEFNVNEEFDWENNKRKNRGFKARMGLRATTSEIARLGEIASLAAELKIQDVSGLQTFVSRETLKSERENCLEEAFKNARMKAEKLAKAANTGLGPATLIQEDILSEEGPRPPPGPILMKGMAMDSASAAPPTIEAGVSRIQLSVRAVFELK